MPTLTGEGVARHHASVVKHGFHGVFVSYTGKVDLNTADVDAEDKRAMGRRTHLANAAIGFVAHFRSAFLTAPLPFFACL